MIFKPVTKKIIKAVMWTVLSVISIVILIIGAATLYLRPDKLTSLANKYANEFIINSSAEIGKVELTFWKSFPYTTLEINRICLTSKAFNNLSDIERVKLPVYADTLAGLDRFSVSLNTLKLLTGTIDIHDVYIRGLYANAVTYSPDLANFNIVPESEDTTSSGLLSLPDIELNTVEISGCKGINYFSLPDTAEINIGITAAQISLLQNKKLQLIADAKATAVTGGKTLVSKIPFKTHTEIVWNSTEPLRIAIDKSESEIGEIPVTLAFDADLNNPLSINKLDAIVGEVQLLKPLKYLPDFIKSKFDGVESNLRATVTANLTKPFVLAENAKPSLNVEFQIPNSYFRYPKGRSLDRIALDASSTIDGENLENSEVILKKLNIDGLAISLKMIGKISKVLTNPRIIGHFKGFSDIEKMMNLAHLEPGYDVKGTLNADTKFNVRLSDIQKNNFNKIDVNGNIRLSDFSMKSYDDSLRIFANNTNLFFGSQKRYNDIESETETEPLLTAKIDADSINLCMNNEMLSVKDASFILAAAQQMKTLSNGKPFLPFGGNIKSRAVQYQMADSTEFRLNKITCTASVQAPENTKSTSPDIKLLLNSHRARYLTRFFRANIIDTEIDMMLSAIVREKKNIPDSVRIARRKARKAREKAEGHITKAQMDSSTRYFLRNWMFGGNIKAKSTRIITPYFPAKNRLKNLDMTFSLDSFVIRSGQLSSGRSSLDVSGSVYNIRKTLMGNKGKPLTARLDLVSDTLDINQMVQLAYSGNNFAKKNADFSLISDSVAEDDKALEKEIANVAGDSATLAFIIPQNIEAQVNLLAKNGEYANMKLKDLSGSINVHKGALQINNLKTLSNAGSLNFNALYAARTLDNVRFAFDLGLKDIKIDRFIDLVPKIDSVMPLLRSMEGVINADIVASTKIDSTMNIVFPSLTAAVKIHGDSLVLFDSETFATISKMLFFKNKKRNMIDNMDVEMLVDNNKMELFPFIFNMDRYKIGVMGNNDLDFNLDYHISVLKSPIPFRFGLNIKGNPDKLKFRLGKAKLKKGKVGSVTSIVNDTRVNLREQLAQAFRKGADAALNSTLEIDRPEFEVISNDSLTAADSAKMIEQGLIQAPVKLTPEQLKQQQKEAKKKRKSNKNKGQSSVKPMDEIVIRKD